MDAGGPWPSPALCPLANMNRPTTTTISPGDQATTQPSEGFSSQLPLEGVHPGVLSSSGGSSPYGSRASRSLVALS